MEAAYAISADARGDTCVRALPGNTASVIVSELIGDGTYQVKANEQVFFRSGKLNQMETTVPDDCGCPPPQIPAMRAAVPVPTVSEKDLPPAVHLAQPGEEAPPSTSGMTAQQEPPSQVTLTIAPPGTENLPAPSPNAPHAQVDAPFVFRASDSPLHRPPTSEPELAHVSRYHARTGFTIAEPPPESRKGRHRQGKGLLLIPLQVGTSGVRPRTSAC